MTVPFIFMRKYKKNAENFFAFSVPLWVIVGSFFYWRLGCKFLRSALDILINGARNDKERCSWRITMLRVGGRMNF